MGPRVMLSLAFAALALVGSALGDLPCVLKLYGEDEGFRNMVFVPQGTLNDRSAFREIDPATGAIKEDGLHFTWNKPGENTINRWMLYPEGGAESAVSAHNAWSEDPDCPDGIGLGGYSQMAKIWLHHIKAPVWNGCNHQNGKPSDMGQFVRTEDVSGTLIDCAEFAMSVDPASTAFYKNGSECYYSTEATPGFVNAEDSSFCTMEFNSLPYIASGDYSQIHGFSGEWECIREVYAFHPNAVAAEYRDGVCRLLREIQQLTYNSDSRLVYITRGMNANLCILEADGALFIPHGGISNGRQRFAEIDRATGALVTDEARTLYYASHGEWRLAVESIGSIHYVSSINPWQADINCPRDVGLGRYNEPPLLWLNRITAPVWASCEASSVLEPQRPQNLAQFTKVAEESDMRLAECSKKVVSSNPAATAVYVSGSACYLTTDPEPQFVAGEGKDAVCTLTESSGVLPYKAQGPTYEKLNGISDAEECFRTVHSDPEAVAAQFSTGNCYSYTPGPYYLRYAEGAKFVYFTQFSQTTTSTTTTLTSTVTTTTTSTQTSTTTSTHTSTLTSTVTSTTTLPFCDHANINLELLYLQELSTSYCGSVGCQYVDDGAERIRKQESIKREMFPMFESLASQFASLKIGYGEFVDKNIEPFGQPDVDFCYKFLNSVVPYDGEYRRWIEDHWAHTWSHSGSGRDYLENQLDATISSVLRGDFSTADFDQDGRRNLRVMFMITDKLYHQYGDVRAEVGPLSCLLGECQDYVPGGDECQCVGHEYPTVDQTVEVLSQHKVNPLFYLGESDASIEAAYSAITKGLKDLNPSLSGAVSVPPSARGAIHEFEPAFFLNALDKICVDVSHYEVART